MNGRFAVIKLRVVMEISVIYTLEDNNLIVRPSILLPTITDISYSCIIFSRHSILTYPLEIPPHVKMGTFSDS